MRRRVIRKETAADLSPPIAAAERLRTAEVRQWQALVLPLKVP